MSLRILFVEDDESNIDAARTSLQEELAAKCCCVSFDEALAEIREFRPHVIVLDIFAGDVLDKNIEGEAILKEVWTAMFCPIVVYSADPNAVQDAVPPNPFIAFQLKGAGSDEEVVRQVKEFQPQIEALREVDEEIGHTIQNVLRDVAPFAINNTGLDDAGRRNFLVRTARRRVAALMDESTNIGSEQLASWEQYLFPPCVSNLLACDLIRERTGNQNAPESYRLVLTPSCDLVAAEGSEPKVEHVLVAKCTSIVEFVRKGAGCNEGTSEKKIREKVIQILPQGYQGAYVPLPGLPDVWPPMAVSLRQLDVISIGDISNPEESGPDEKEFVRVASIDSPFREMIAWAYAQFTGRPGLPERDFDSWAKDIAQTVKGNESSERQA